MSFGDQYEPRSFGDQYATKSFGDQYAEPSFGDQYKTVRMPRPPTSGEQMDQFVGQLGDVGSVMGHAIVPAVAAAGATALLPELLPGYAGAALTGGLSGVGGGVISRGASNLMSGKSPLDGTTAGSMLMDAGVGAASGMGLRALTSPTAVAGYRAVGNALGGAVDRARDALPLRTAAVRDLPGFDEATTLRAPLPAIEQLPLTWADEPNMRVNRADLELTPLQAARTKVSSPRFVTSRNTDSQAAQIAADRLLVVGKVARSERAQAQAMRAQSGVGALGEMERRAALVAQAGHFDDLPPEFQTEPVELAGDALRFNLYEAASDKLRDSRSVTVTPTGEAIPYQPHREYTPGILREMPERAQTLGQRLGLRSRPPQTSFQIADNYGQRPWQQALDELRDIEGPRGPWNTDADAVAQAYIEGGGGRVGYPELVARSHAFGPIAEEHPDATHPWGQDANVLYQQMLQARQPLDADLFRHTMDDLYRPQRREGFEQLMSQLKDRAGHLLLGQTAVKQLSQAATPVWRFGIGDNARGLYDYAADPSYGELAATSGARDAPYARELGGAGNTIPRAAMEAVEGTLRTVGNAGTKPYVERLARLVQEADAAGQPYNAALRKQLAEMRLTPAQLRGGVDANTLSQAFETAAHRNNFHPYAPGESGALFNDPIGKNLTLYQTFGQSAHRLAQEDVLEPLLGWRGWRDAYRSGDYSLQGLGAARAARMVAAGVPAAAATELVKSAVSLRPPDLGNVADNFLGTNFGTVGQLGSATATRGIDGAWDDITQSPVVATVKQQLRNVKTGHLERPAYDYLALRDRTGTLSALRPAWNNITKGD